MNETLEAMARALFKSWFVDFDPVRAKAEGRDPGLPQPLADLFSDSLEDSELGEIPLGWRWATIGNVADVIDVAHAKKPEHRNSGRPLLQLANIRDDGLLDDDRTFLIDQSDYQAWTLRMEASPGDCVITNVGRVGAVAQIPPDVSAALGRHMTGVRCKPTFPVPRPSRSDTAVGVVPGRVRRRTSVQFWSTLDVRSIPHLRLVAPDTPVVEHFEQFVRAVYRAQCGSDRASQARLPQLRDALLPRLISGELRVPDAERMAAEVRSMTERIEAARSAASGTRRPTRRHGSARRPTSRRGSRSPRTSRCSARRSASSSRSSRRRRTSGPSAPTSCAATPSTTTTS